MLHYSNGSWHPETLSQICSGLNGVHFTSPNKGWAVGYGCLLHYLNGEWAPATPPEGVCLGLESVHFASPDEGWAVGGCNSFFPKVIRTVLLHYSNSIWTPVTNGGDIPGEGRLHSVHFASPSEGWAVGNTGGEIWPRSILYHYSSSTWTLLDTEQGNFGTGLLGVYFISPDEGWAVGNDREPISSGLSQGLLLHYLNGSWASVPPPEVSSSWSLHRVYFSSPNEGWAVGSDSANNRGVLLKYSPAPQAETVSSPYVPSGPEIGKIVTSYTYSTEGSHSSLGNPVEYQFDWRGDSSDLSDWGSGTESKAWTTPGFYKVRARARSVSNVSVVSLWSKPLPVSISLPIISVNPTSWYFGNAEVNTSKSASFKVKNEGMADLLVSTSLTGADASMFRIKRGSGSKIVKPGKTMIVRVAFKPESTGLKSSILRINSNDPNSPAIDISLDGTGQ